MGVLTSFLRSLWVRMKDSLKYMFTVPGTARNSSDLVRVRAIGWERGLCESGGGERRDEGGEGEG